ncbi:MAG TPA: class I adenylate-forming enzyme family protein [Stellaceae bacterium]|nr:class I adenylate-forming enzyme family protein [Stellaceae bacterium]
MAGYPGDNVTTADFIAYRAAERPEATALVDGGRAITYAEFARDLRKFTAAARDLGLPRGSSVAVGCEDYYTHWLLLLALERHGIATASLVNVESPGNVALRACVDCVLAAPGFATASARRHLSLTADWLRRAWAGSGAETDAAPAGPEDPVRVLQSSGTTGAPKRVVLLRRMFEARVRQFAAQFEFTSRSLYLLTAGLNVWHVYGVATACLRAGGAVVTDFVTGKLGLAQAVTAHGITQVSLFPITLKRVLEELPQDFVKPPNLAIHSFGAPITEALRDLALERLAVDLYRNYGCNEAAAAFASRTSRKDGFASVWPDTTVEIVDDEDRLLPPGSIGRIRLKTPCMVEGYPDDPETTRRYFRDGWFYPEDMGVLNEARQLKVIGRRDEMLNIGGEKVPPDAFESQALKHAEVTDVGVCTFANASGVEEVYFAVAFQQGDTAEILRRIADAFKGFALGAYYVVRLPSIPRNANGKIERNRLKQAVAAAIGLKA